MDVNLLCAFLDLFLFRQQEFQDAIFIFGLDPVGIDLVVEAEAPFEAPEGEFLADRLVFFGSGFILLFKSDRQLTVVEGQRKVFFAAAGGAELQMIGVSGLVDVDGRKAKAFVLYRETLKKLIDELGKVPMSAVVYFYECHTIVICVR